MSFNGWSFFPGPIRRARAYYLYTHNGKRYLDLYQNGGYALLGHRPPKLNHHLKNLLEKGLLYNLPSVYTGRLQKALLGKFPEFDRVLVFDCRAQASDFLNATLKTANWQGMVCDPLLNLYPTAPSVTHQENGRIAVYRPLAGDLPLPRADVLVPLLPFQIGQGPFILCLKKGLPAVPARQGFSPLLAAGSHRVFHNLEKHSLPVWYRPDLVTGHNWRQSGLYLIPRFDPEDYPAVFRAFLEQRFILSPTYDQPSILPQELSAGELALLLRLLKSLPKGV